MSKEVKYCDTPELQYEFIELDKLQSVYDIEEIQEKPCKVYNFFREYKEEIIYITRVGMIYGLLSIGDMYRYYRNEEEVLPINRKFSYVEDAEDFAGAEAFFRKVATVHEIPVIKEGMFLGIIRKKHCIKTKSRQDLFYGLRYERMLGWKRQKLRHFYNVCPAKMLCYDMPRDIGLTPEDETTLQRRRYGNSNTLQCLAKMSEQEQRNFVGERYHEKYMECFILDYNQLRLCHKNGVYSYADCCNDTFHIENGYRRTSNVSGTAGRKIWMFGMCTVFGTCVCDDETIEFYLQEYLLSHGYNSYDVINAGVMQGEISRMFTEQISSDDIVILIDSFTDMHRNVESVEGAADCYKGSLSEVYAEIEHPMECILDSPAHCNYLVNKKIAEKIYNDILPDLSRNECGAGFRTALQSCFIPWDVIEYYEEYVEKLGLYKESDKKTGAIVMNCNPFTLGHRYLIEQASNQVDKLYIFVVEEDKSYFSFKDRLEMVRQGTKDIDNVHVFPSGKYIISQETFEQYFDKENVILQVDDMDYDVRIFGEVVANMLGISCRFVGEEPFDVITEKYNNTMKRILPEYHIELIEIPCKEKDGICISASKVRKYLEEGEMEKAYMLVPESTRQYIKNIN